MIEFLHSIYIHSFLESRYAADQKFSPSFCFSWRIDKNWWAMLYRCWPVPPFDCSCRSRTMLSRVNVFSLLITRLIFSSSHHERILFPRSPIRRTVWFISDYNFGLSRRFWRNNLYVSTGLFSDLLSVRSVGSLQSCATKFTSDVFITSSATFWVLALCCRIFYIDMYLAPLIFGTSTWRGRSLQNQAEIL